MFLFYCFYSIFSQLIIFYIFVVMASKSEAKRVIKKGRRKVPEPVSSSLISSESKFLACFQLNELFVFHLPKFLMLSSLHEPCLFVHWVNIVANAKVIQKITLISGSFGVQFAEKFLGNWCLSLSLYLATRSDSQNWFQNPESLTTPSVQESSSLWRSSPPTSTSTENGKTYCEYINI